MPTRIRKIGNAAATALASTPHGIADELFPHGFARLLRAPWIAFALSGCAPRGAPSFALFGAYFPAWMLCALIGIVCAVGARAALMASGLSSALPFQLFVCMAIGACFAVLAWLFWFA
jgi:hypothetical protein